MGDGGDGPDARPKLPASEGRQGARLKGHRAEGTLVALFGPKGGSGTSVLACNLAIAMSERTEGGVALVEVGEGVGSQAVLLNLRADRNMGDLLARFDPGDTEILDGILATHASGLRVLLAPPSPGLRIPPDLLDDVLATLQQMFAYVVIDVATSARNSAVQLFRKANAMMVVITPEMTGLQQGRVYVETMEATMADVRLNIILNRSTIPSGVPADAIRRHLKMQIAAEIPDDQGLVTSSINRGVPLAVSHPRSSLARAVQKLAGDLMPEDAARAGDRSTQAAGLFGRFAARGRSA